MRGCSRAWIRRNDGPVFHRGDIHWGDLDPQKGSEQGGRRPVLIFQDDRLNRAGNTIVVIPFTTSLRWARLPSCVLIPKGTGGLPQDSVALCHQIRVLDKRGIHGRIGTLPTAVLADIERIVRTTLGL
jgi:mRNA interferase MazF